MDATLDISVVVPLYNEEESLPELVEWIDRVARGEGLSYEVILVDDGSGDGSWRVIESLHERFAACLLYTSRQQPEALFRPFRTV